MAYRTQSPDTSPEIEKIQFGLMRRAGVRRRLELSRAHTHSAIGLARRRIARAHPDWSEQEVALHWAALTYGEELATRVRQYLQREKTGC